MKKDCTILVAKTKALISFAVTAKLICALVFEYMQNVGFLMVRLIYYFATCYCFAYMLPKVDE